VHITLGITPCTCIRSIDGCLFQQSFIEVFSGASTRIIVLLLCRLFVWALTGTGVVLWCSMTQWKLLKRLSMLCEALLLAAAGN